MITLSAFAYLMGWRVATAYYTELGAPWVVAMLSPLQLLQSSGWIAPAVCFFAVTGLQFFSTTRKSEGDLWRINMWVLGIAGLNGLLTIFAFTPITSKVQFYVHFLNALIFAVCAGIAVAETVYRIVSLRKWTWSMTFTSYLVIVWSAWVAPVSLGTDRARTDLSTASKLPRVSLNQQADAEIYALVEVIGDSALLLNRVANSRIHTFRLIKISDIRTIVPPQIELR